MTTKPVHFALAFALMAVATPSSAQRRISEDRDLKELDLTGWDCANRAGGTAKTDDGVDRNQGKNRAPIDLSKIKAPSMETAGFLRNVSAWDAQTKGQRRQDLNSAQESQLHALEKQVVSLTAYLVIAYAGPPETTNCASVDFHDWHLELFAKPQDHAPSIGDPTPIICEITPRTQNAIFRDGIRLQKLAGFFRHTDLESEPTGQPPQRVRITGYLLWDDEHNGAADIGTRVQTIAKNKFHQPWRSTAWEIHPVLKIEALDGAAVPAPASAPPEVATPAAVAASPPPAAPAAPPAVEVTMVEAVRIKTPYGETVLPRGFKLPMVSRDARTVTVRYMGQTLAVPLQSTDLR